MQKNRVFSGIQPSGEPTLGNYLGAFKRQVALQETHDTLYCVVDLHAITARQDPAELYKNSFGVAAWYVASGLDPAKASLFLQSHVPAHTELGWILNTFTQMGELERMTQFKDKAKQHKHNINAGLFTYPALMAADVLLYDIQEVPVGEDQTQHVELMRDIAIRFNNAYGDTFVVPKHVIPATAARVRDLQTPEKKMSKSLPGPGCIMLTEDLSAIEKKIKRAVTDTLNRIAYDEENQIGLANLLEIYAACENITVHQAVEKFEGSGYGALKTAVAEAVVSELEPIQKRYNELMSDHTHLKKILKQGAEKAAAKADETLRRVKDKVGFVPKEMN